MYEAKPQIEEVRKVWRRKRKGEEGGKKKRRGKRKEGEGRGGRKGGKRGEEKKKKKRGDPCKEGRLPDTETRIPESAIQKGEKDFED